MYLLVSPSLFPNCIRGIYGPRGAGRMGEASPNHPLTSSVAKVNGVECGCVLLGVEMTSRR